MAVRGGGLEIRLKDGIQTFIEEENVVKMGKFIHKYVAVILFTGMTLVSNISWAAFDAFVKIDGIEGESNDDQHIGWIEALSFRGGVSQSASYSNSSGGTTPTERPEFEDITIVKTLDKASPLLYLYSAKGSRINEVIIELNREGGDKQKYYEIKLSDVIVSKVRTGGLSTGEETLPKEEVSFNYGKIEWTYTHRRADGGGGGGTISTGWDLENNSEIEK